MTKHKYAYMSMLCDPYNYKCKKYMLIIRKLCNNE